MVKRKNKKTGLGGNQLEWIRDTASEATRSSKLVEVPLDQLVESERLQFRQELPDIETLARDIKQRGQTTPAFVRLLPGGKYELISGYRRLAAIRRLNLEVILARVFPDLSDKETERLAISENLQRKDLSDLEHGKETPRALIVGKIEEALDVSPGSLMVEYLISNAADQSTKQYPVELWLPKKKSYFSLTYWVRRFFKKQRKLYK